MKGLAIFSAVSALLLHASNAPSSGRRHRQRWGKITDQNDSHINGIVTMLANGDESKT